MKSFRVSTEQSRSAAAWLLVVVVVVVVVEWISKVTGSRSRWHLLASLTTIDYVDLDLDRRI